MPVYLYNETMEAKERMMHDDDPSDSPRLAAVDLAEAAGMMRGLAALAVKRGRPLPLNDTSYTSEDLDVIANRLQQIADYFNDVRKLIRTGKTKETAAPKAKGKAKPPSVKVLIGALEGADREFAEQLTPNDQGLAGIVLRSRCREEAWAMVLQGDVRPGARRSGMPVRRAGSQLPDVRATPLVLESGYEGWPDGPEERATAGQSGRRVLQDGRRGYGRAGSLRGAQIV